MTRDKLYQIYETISTLLIKEKVYLDPMVTFPLLCAWTECDSKEMNEIFMEELGMSGKEFIENLRITESAALIEKYGLKMRF